MCYFKSFNFIPNRNCANENLHPTYQAAKLIGRQEGSDAWVIDDKTQINGRGQLVPEEDMEYVWIDDLLDDLFDDQVKTREVLYPLRTEAINNVLRSLKESLHNNFIG